MASALTAPFLNLIVMQHEGQLEARVGGVLGQAGTFFGMVGAGGGLFWADRVLVGSSRFSWAYAAPVLAALVLGGLLVLLSIVFLLREREAVRVAKIESDAEAIARRTEFARVLRLLERQDSARLGAPVASVGGAAALFGAGVLPVSEGLVAGNPIDSLRDSYERLVSSESLPIALGIVGALVIAIFVLHAVRRFELSTARILDTKLRDYGAAAPA
jgi:hypothetical protein